MSLIKRLLLLTRLLVLVGLYPVAQAQQDLFQQGMGYLNVGFYDQAVTAFAQLLHREPENALAHCQLGAAYRLQDRLSDAISAYEKALTLEASADIYGTAHLCLAMIHQEEGVFDKAKLYALEAVVLLPQTAKAYLTLGKIDPYYRADGSPDVKCQGHFEHLRTSSFREVCLSMVVLRSDLAHRGHSTFPRSACPTARMLRQRK